MTKIITTTVFDPALSGRKHEQEHTRLELWVDSLPEEVTHSRTTDKFTVSHYSWAMKIFSDLPEWDDEKPETCAAIFNSSGDAQYPVVPVTMRVGDEFWEVYYVKVEKVRTILERYEKQQERRSWHGGLFREFGYEIIPDPTWAIDLQNAWYFSNKMRTCTRCASEILLQPNDGSDEVLKEMNIAASKVEKGDPVEVYPHRLVTLCRKHKSEFHSQAYRFRESQED